MKVLSFGEVLWDIYPDKKFIGGAPFNFSAHLSKHGHIVSLISAVGADAYGDDALCQLKTHGILTDYISVLDNKQTGACLVTLDCSSVPTYNLLQDVSYDYISCNEVSGEFDVLYFGTLSLRSLYNYASLKKLIENNCFGEIFVDLNIRPPFYSEETVVFALQKATILKISIEEMPMVAKMLQVPEYTDYKDFARYLKDVFSNLKCIIVTLGSEGAYAFDCATNKEVLCGSVKTKVASTVGAGDSFSAAFLHKYQNDDLKSSLQYANKVAAFVVSEYDAVPDYKANLL